MIKIDADIQGLNEYGEGTFRGRSETVKIPRAFPGDRARVCFEPSGKPFVSGVMDKLLRPSPLRVEPGCKAWGAGCGGCQWLGLNYGAQLEWKQKILADVLLRRGGMEVQVLPTLGMSQPEPRAYRNKMSLVNSGGHMAFLKDHSDEPVFPKVCSVETAPNTRVWESVRDWTLPPEVLQVHLRSGGGAVGVCFFVKRMSIHVTDLAQRFMKVPGVVGVGASSYRSYDHLEGQDWVEETVGGFKYRIPLNGFFQTNTPMAGVLLEQVLGQLGTGPSLLDLYCGGGFFSIPAAPQFSKVLGVENNAESIKTAMENRGLNPGKTRPDFICSDVGRALSGLKPGSWQTVLLDPPRSGCDEGVLKHLLRLSPRKIVYVSCSPESLARDLKILAKRYQVSYCRSVDLFPHTFHMETVVTLQSPGG